MSSSLWRLRAKSRVFSQYFLSGAFNEHYIHRKYVRVSLFPQRAHDLSSGRSVKKCSHFHMFSTIPEIPQQVSLDVNKSEAIKAYSSTMNEHYKKVRETEGNSVKQSNNTKEPYVHYLRNLLLYFPGCISTDEDGNRLFFSDTDHHRILVVSGSGKILDCIGSFPGFEDGEFEFAKLFRPAASLYHAEEDCLYIADSENHAVRRAHIGKRILETLYPTSFINIKDVGVWIWILNKLGMKTESSSKSEKANIELLLHPWHLMLSRDNKLLSIDRSFQTMWVMDIDSGKIKETVAGFQIIADTCKDMISEKLSLLNRIFETHSKYKVCFGDSLDRACLMSTVAVFQNDIVFCDAVSRMVLKLNKESGAISKFEFSNFGVLGLPYWMSCPVEKAVTSTDVCQKPRDRIQRFSLLPGRCDIQVTIEIPEDVELAATLEEGCIWRQARGSAVEISESGSLDSPIEKVGIAQQWFDELDTLAFTNPGLEDTVQDQNKNPEECFQDQREVHVSSAVNISPGTSEVIISTVIYLRMKNQSRDEDNKEKKVKKIINLLEDGSCEEHGKDSCIQLMLDSGRDVEDFVFMIPVRLRVILECADNPVPVESKEAIITNSIVKVKVLL